jgi:hypothetical protein
MRLKAAIAIASVLSLLLVAATVGVGSGSTSERPGLRPPPQYAHPTRAARRLIHRYFALVHHKNVAGLQRFLSPAFQVERADGSGGEKAAYLKDLPTIRHFRIRRVHGTQAGAVLVARYRAIIKGVLNGRTYAPGPAPRLSFFDWTGRRWQIAGHANFDPLKG